MNIASLINLLVSYSFWCIFGISLVGYSFSLFMGAPSKIELFLIIFLMLQALYALNRLTDKEEDKITNPGRASFIVGKEKHILAFVGVSFLVSLSLAVMQNLLVFLFLIIILLIGFFYSFKSFLLKRLFGFYRFKDVLFGKNVVIGLTWSFLAVFVPMFYYSRTLTLGVAVLGIFIFLRGVINTALFDLRDVSGDKKVGVKTIPVVFGSKPMIMTFYALNFFIGVLIFLSVFYSILPFFAHFLNISTIWSFSYLYLIDKPKIINQKLLLEFVIDGEYFLIAISVIFGAFLAGV